MKLELKGIYKNNLKIDVLELPLNKIIFLTGPSGSGKSTLARDVLYRTGRRLYLESLGLEEGGPLVQFEDSGVEQIKSLPPTVLLDQIPERVSSSREVGHFTGLLPSLKLIMALSGTPFCPKCHVPIPIHTLNDIKKEIMSLEKGTRLTLTTPLPKSIQMLQPNERIKWIISQGFVRVQIGQDFVLLEDLDNIDEGDLEGMTIVIDRIVLKDSASARVYEAVRLVESLESKVLKAFIGRGPDRVFTFSLDHTCPKCLETYPKLSSRTFSPRNPTFQCKVCQGHGCKSCANTGLGTYSRAVKLGGARFEDLYQMTIKELDSFLATTLKASQHSDEVATNLLVGLRKRLQTLKGAGLGHLEVSRPLTAISRGEFQRLRLSTQVNLGISGTLVILDEPTTGLHPKDFHYIINLIKGLRARGNTVIVVEHDEAISNHCDWVLQLGPGSGRHGGRIIFNGPLDDYDMAGDEGLPTPFIRTKSGPTSFQLLQATQHIDIPLGGLTFITGVSGSGKTRFLEEVLAPRLKEAGITVDHLSQSPIRGNKWAILATFLGIFTPIREIFSKTKGARLRGFTPTIFSLAKDGGRCPTCKGTGQGLLDLDEIPQLEVPCPSCGGLRYKEDVLTCQFKGKSIVDVLNLTVKEAVGFFSRFPRIRRPLEVLQDSGMGYLTLGQPLSSLSGGEAMRLRLATLFSKELQRTSGLKDHALLLDEPSAGLSSEDVLVLVDQLMSLRKMGLTEVVIDHEEAIKAVADLVVEFGPGDRPLGENIVSLERRF